MLLSFRFVRSYVGKDTARTALLHSPLLFDPFDDPASRPNMFVFEVNKKLDHCFSLFGIGHKGTPYEDGMANCYRKWYRLW
jgi:hypothetical protein